MGVEAMCGTGMRSTTRLPRQIRQSLRDRRAVRAARRLDVAVAADAPSLPPQLSAICQLDPARRLVRARLEAPQGAGVEVGDGRESRNRVDRLHFQPVDGLRQGVAGCRAGKT